MANPVIDVISDHRSVREYEAQELERRQIEEAVLAGQRASTSSNVQAYCCLRITDSRTRKKLSELAGNQRQVEESGAFLVICGDVRRHQLIAERAGQPFEQSLESFLIAVIDASLFAQNLALAFESTGLGICYVGGLRNALHEVDDLLGLPAGVFPIYGMCVGTPRGRPDRKPRLPIDAVLFDDAYPNDEEMLDLVDEYDRTMGEYYDARGIAGRAWSAGISKQVAQRKRPYLAAYYRDKGARLD